MPNKEFLEKYPLYRQFKTDWREYGSYQKILDDIPKPPVHMYCDICDSNQTFNMENEYYETEDSRDVEAAGKILRARYLCSACEQGQRIFLIRFYRKIFKEKDSEDKEENKIQYLCAMKVGQYPPWSIEPDRRLEKSLGEYSDYYKKGLTCESQSYGIGAYAYFRRITEAIIDDLLESISDLIEPDKQEKYKLALSKMKKTKVTEEKIDLVKELLPPSLRPGGRNPLRVLHSTLSIGLHGKTDEECMEQAEIIKKVLVYLVNQVLKAKEENQEFDNGMKRLLDKKTETVSKNH